MANLESITTGTRVNGILANRIVQIVAATWHGSNTLEVFYKDDDGTTGSRLLYRPDEGELDLENGGRAWSFDADAGEFRLVSEAMRIRLAHLFDPLVAVNSSDIEPLPHQITAVYEKMLQRQPLRYLLADDPGAGKTIMAGLLIKELYLRGDLERCMVVCPGNLAEQWQDELQEKFDLPFEILTNDKLEAAATGNWFGENDLVIARLDKLSRDEDLHPKLRQTDWDLIIVDEAHKMSATYFGNEVKYTKRYHLGQLLSTITRHFLLLTATPHNGKEEDFHLFLALLDGDRFEGRLRDGVHSADPRDLMRRLIKEQLVRFDGSALFPERRAYTVNYELSQLEAHLYQEVTGYVREEFNRAEQLEEGRKGNVGFALTILQRRLASSPAAIHSSLRRRRERLDSRRREQELIRKGKKPRSSSESLKLLGLDELEDIDDAPDAEAEELEDLVVDQATTARTIEELEKEIETLKRLEQLAAEVVKQGTDRKWEEVSKLLQTEDEMFDASGSRRKLVLFTEHKDTLKYLARRIRTLLGRDEAVVTISGGMGREERKAAEQRFKQDPDVEILVATDAAGEGINLQRAHLMINYDLPWNPNRLEQRFGRIHRIGQTEVCHLWNLVAAETREGDVFKKLLTKLEKEKDDLHGRVFDVLGQVFQGNELRDLLVRAVRTAGENPSEQQQVFDRLDELLDSERLRELIEKNALSEDTLDRSSVQEIRDLMDRARVRKLQPHFIRQFFLEAFRRLGGTAREREPNRYELTHVPHAIRNRDRVIGRRNPVLTKYERITFDRDLEEVAGKPVADLVAPGHPLLSAVIDLVLERYRALLKKGSILVDDAEDAPVRPRVLVYLRHVINDGQVYKGGLTRSVSERLQFVEIDEDGTVTNGGFAPFLDYRPPTDAERDVVEPMSTTDWLSERLDQTAVSYAVEHLVPEHLHEVKTRREAIVEKTRREVKQRLTQELAYWDHRAATLREEERSGKVNAKINSKKAAERVDELERRLKRRLDELDAQRSLSPQPPNVIGAALVVPARMLAPEHSEEDVTPAGLDKDAVETAAMDAVMRTERELGHEPRDVSVQNAGWDIESRDGVTGSLRLIEVKGRRAGQATITVSKNEMLKGFNEPEQFILALVFVDGDTTEGPYYVRKAFDREPGWNETSVNLDVGKLLSVAERPR